MGTGKVVGIGILFFFAIGILLYSIYIFMQTTTALEEHQANVQGLSGLPLIGSLFAGIYSYSAQEQMRVLQEYKTYSLMGIAFGSIMLVIAFIALAKK